MSNLTQPLNQAKWPPRGIPLVGLRHTRQTAAWTHSVDRTCFRRISRSPKNFRTRAQGEFRMDANNIFNHPVLGSITTGTIRESMGWDAGRLPTIDKTNTPMRLWTCWTAILFATRDRRPCHPDGETPTGSPFVCCNRGIVSLQGSFK